MSLPWNILKYWMQPNYDDTTCFPPGHLGKQHTGTSKAVYRQEKLSEQLESEDVRTMPFSGNQSYIPWTVRLTMPLWLGEGIVRMHQRLGDASFAKMQKQLFQGSVRKKHDWWISLEDLKNFCAAQSASAKICNDFPEFKRNSWSSPAAQPEANRSPNPEE